MFLAFGSKLQLLRASKAGPKSFSSSYIYFLYLLIRVDRFCCFGQRVEKKRPIGFIVHRHGRNFVIARFFLVVSFFNSLSIFFVFSASFEFLPDIKISPFYPYSSVIHLYLRLASLVRSSLEPALDIL